MLLGALGLVIEVQITTLILAALVGLVISFFEYDSLPRKLQVLSGRVTFEDASGEMFTIRDFGLKRCLWLTRIVFTRGGSVHSILLEAFVGTVQLTRSARGAHPAEGTQWAEQGADDQAAAAVE